MDGQSPAPLGFVLQLVGYALTFEAPQLLAYAAGFVCAATLAGAWLARTLAKRFMRTGTKPAREAIEEADRRAGIR